MPNVKYYENTALHGCICLGDSILNSSGTILHYCDLEQHITEESAVKRNSSSSDGPDFFLFFFFSVLLIEPLLMCLKNLPNPLEYCSNMNTIAIIVFLSRLGSVSLKHCFLAP